ncbi:MAG: hypothetical protein R3B70_19570 [Polyangiaceae bacterium]
MLEQVGGVDERAGRVELDLVLRAVADAHGQGAPIALEVGEDPPSGSAAVDRIHHLEAVLRSIVADEVEEVARFGGEAEEVRGADGEGGVARPGVAIVPVAGVADPLGREVVGGDHGACRGVDEQLEAEGGAQHVVAWRAVVGEARAPLPPCLSGGAELLEGAIGVYGLGNDGVPREHHPAALSGGEGEAHREAAARAGDPGGAVVDDGGEALSGGAVREDAVLVLLEAGSLHAEAEARVEHDVQLDAAFEALDATVDLVDRGARVVVPWHEVCEADAPWPGIVNSVSRTLVSGS